MHLLLLTLLACDLSPSQVPPVIQEPTAAERETPQRAQSAPDSQLYAALLARHQAEGATPEGALSLWLYCALLAGEANPARAEAGLRGLQHLTLPYRDDDRWYELASNRTFVDRLHEQPYIFRSYGTGTSPEGGYAVDPEHMALEITRTQDAGDLGLKVFVVSTGADSPRPVYMKKSTSTGLYYVANHANLYVGVRPPVDPTKERFE